MKQNQGKYYNMIELTKIKLNNYYIAIGFSRDEFYMFLITLKTRN